MKKLRLLLLDANIVIKLFEEGIWGDVVSRYEIHVARSVFGEVQFVKDKDGFAETISLKEDEDRGHIKVFEVGVSKLEKFKGLFVSTVIERIDPGELESLVFLFSQSEEYRLASADGVVFRILGGCNRGDQGISLEEILDQIGLNREIEKQFGKDFREHLTNRGFAEQMQDRLLRSGRSIAECEAIARSQSI
jgi:hypothetical protein